MIHHPPNIEHAHLRLGLHGAKNFRKAVAESGAECVLMHMQGTPQTMQDNPNYADVVEDIFAYLRARYPRATIRIDGSSANSRS